MYPGFARDRRHGRRLARGRQKQGRNSAAYPYLETADIDEALAYAAWRAEEPSCRWSERMNPKSVDEARDRDLPKALIALRRAARRAHEIARRTDTRVVIMRAGRIEFLKPFKLDAGR